MHSCLFRDYAFEAAHRLPNVDHNHKCARLHGHTFKVRVSLSGTVCGVMGWVVDFSVMDDAMGEALTVLDHSYLNETIENPTSERIAKWIWDCIAPSLQTLESVTVQETCDSGATYRGD